MPIEVLVNDAPYGYCHDRFYAVRIGSAEDNEIVLADPNVHPYHCTLVHTGSTYRLDVPPCNLVYLDGERVRGDVQFMLDSDSAPEGVTLTLGMTPEAKGIDAPRKVRLAYVPQAMLKEKLRKNLLRRKRINRENWQGPFNWLVVGLIAAIVTFAGLWTKSQLDIAQQDSRIREAQLLFDAGKPQRTAELQQQLESAMIRVGLAKDGRFMPVGTGWLWDNGGRIWLVTNRHVRDQVFNCATAQATDATDCRGMQGACPAAHHYDAANASAPPIILAGCRPDAQVELAEPLKHPDYDRFEGLFPGNGRDDAEVPNIFDVALFEWPAEQAPWGRGLKLAPAEQRAGITQNVATVGFPLEGEGAGGVLARTWTFRPASVGRLSDPFGMPGGEQHFLVLTGSEVQGGESGGPVINQNGDVIGMLFGGYFTRSPGEETSGRLSIGNKVRALDAALIIEAANGGPVEEVKTARQARWDAGIGLLGSAFHERILRQQVADTCKTPKDIVAVPLGEPRTIVVDRPAGEVAVSTGFQPHFAWSETLRFERNTALDPKIMQTFVVTVSSETRESPVFMRMKRVVGAGQYVRWISSNSALTSLASMKEDVQFAGADVADFEAFVYSEREAKYTLGVYRIACERKA